MPDHRLKSKATKFRTPRRTAKFRVGDSVKVRFGTGLSAARIIEDRGPIGINGRRLVRVQIVGSEPDVDLAFEVPVEELVPA